MGRPAFLYKWMGSLECQDTSSTEGADAIFVLNGPGVATPGSLNEFIDTAETGRSTFLASGAPHQISKRWGPKTLSFIGSHDALTYFSYWAAHGDGDAGTPIQLGSTSYYLQQWTDDMAGTSPRSFSGYDMSYPGTDSDQENHLIHNCVVQNVEISGARDQMVGLSATILGGGNVGDAAGTGGLLAYRVNRFNFNLHCALITNATTQNPVAAGTAACGTSGTLGTDTTRIDGSGTPADWSGDWHGFTLSINTAYNLEQSIVPGGLGYVEKSSNWIIDGHDITLTLQMRQGATNTDTLVSEYKAQTPRAFEIQMINPVALDTGAYASYYASLGLCYPIQGSYSENVLGDMGQRVSTIQYRAHTTGSNVKFAGTFGATSTVLGSTA